MRLEWQIETTVASISPAVQAVMERAAQAAVQAETLPGKYQACVVLTDDVGIRDINRRTRGIDRATDVLSYPLARFPRGTARDHPQRLRALLDPDTGHMHLGDVVISVDHARSQALAYGHSEQRELGYLLVHGMCHLMGYDHEQADDQARMRALEEQALQCVALEREEATMEQKTMQEIDQQMLEMARQAMEQAYAPYSKYRVGACLMAEDGRLFTGCNVENASYGGTICAERTAVTKAVSEGARAFTAIAIAGSGSAPYPCGICRQVLNEFGPAMRVLITWDGETRETTLEALLPHGFGPQQLGGRA